jgi:mono/diheme cytochrome c family protein
MDLDKVFTRKRKFLAAVFASCLLLVISFQNCSAIGSANDSKLSKASLENDILGAQALEILSSKCLTCHNPDKPEGGISDITDLNFLLYYRLVIPGQPEISDIIRVIKEGSMPPGGGVSTSDLSALNKWILEGLIDDSGNVAIPDGSATLEAKYSSIKTRIINTRCLGCHSGAAPSGGVDLTTYATTVANNIAIAGNPNGSRFITSLLRPGNDFMPRNGARLPTADIDIIRAWIQAGALNN